jgi:hypothetical protein
MAGDVTLETPAGNVARSTSLKFTTPNPVTSISVEFNPDAGNGPRETVYDGTDAANLNGTFSYLYRFSKRTGNEWEIIRENGWPAKAQLRIKEASSFSAGGGLTSRAALTPGLYSPIGQWALQGWPDSSIGYLDRSGNGYHLDHGAPTYGADLIPGARAARPVVGQKLQRKTITPAMQLVGDLTFQIRFKIDGLGTPQQLLSFSSVYAPDWAHGTMYEFGIGPDGSFWYARTANPFADLDYVHSPTLRVMPGQWHVGTLRRIGSTVRFGLDLSFEDANAEISPPPQVSSGSYLTLGSDGDSDNEVHGLIADASLWGAGNTDDEQTGLIAVALGL